MVQKLQEVLVESSVTQSGDESIFCSNVPEGVALPIISNGSL